jgi:hypothetical protein
MGSHGWLKSTRPKKMLILNVNGMLCYVPQCVVQQGNARVFGRNIDKNKVEVRIGVEHFISNVFKKFYIAIWPCMKLEDVLEVLPMLMLEKFMDEFVFIWGCEQCLKTSSQITPRSYYYIKDLKHVYYACCGLPYGMEDQILPFDDKPSKVLQNPKWSGFFLESFRGVKE